MRVLRAAVAPLVRRSTYRRLMFLLLGSAAAVGFASLGVMLVGPRLPAGPALAGHVVRGVGPLVPLLPVAAAIGLLRSTLVIQRNLARGLLGVPAADLPAGAVVSAGHRWRSAAFFVLHVCAGYAFGLLMILLAGFVLLTVPAFVDPTGQGLPDPAGFRRFGPAIILALLLMVLYVAALLGAGFARLAARLLGPTPDERVAALHLRIRGLAEHNRLARELHDSVGHALSVVSVQANAARRVLDRDPETARAALAAITESAKRAQDDLDHVLALLRVGPDGPDGAAPQRPQSTLADLDALLTDVRAAGLSVDLRRTGDLAAVPAVVSREAYRIVQEGLTNALRHAGPVPVTLVIRTDGGGLAMELSNGLSRAARQAVNGRGLTGIRERVALLGGTVSAGPRDGRWQVAVYLP